MKNLKEVMKTVKKLEYTKEEIDDIISTNIYNSGTKALIVTLEEIGELINVISENTVGKTDYIHTVEEITDVLITLEYCIHIAHIREDELKTEINISIKKHRLMSYIYILSQTQQSITKFMRHATKSRQQLILCMIKTYTVIDELIKFYNIDKSDIDKMTQIKITRLKDRIENNIML